jgi:hypothetical protein
LRNGRADADYHASNSGISKMNIITFTRDDQPQVLPQTATRFNGRDIRPQIRPQTATRPDGERLFIFSPTGWRTIPDPTKEVTFCSPTDGARISACGYWRFKTLSEFEDWLFSFAHSRYQRVGSASVHIPTRQVGLGRRFAVNNLDIVIREYEYEGRQKFLAIAAVRIRNASVAVVLKAGWSAIAENRKHLETCAKSVRFIPKH